MFNTFRDSYYKPILSLFLFIPIVETIFIAIYISEIYLPLFLIWVISSIFFNFSYKVSLFLSSWYLICSFIFIATNNTFFANRLAIWFYLFFTFSMVLLAVEEFIFPKKKKENPAVVSILSSQLEYVIYQSTIQIRLIIVGLIYLICVNLIYQVRYFYWFFTFRKFERFFWTTGIYEIIFNIIILIYSYYFLRKLRFRIYLISYLISVLILNSSLFFLTTIKLKIDGDTPKISEVQRIDDHIMIYGHNFRRWPNEYSKLYLNQQEQEFTFWSSNLIIISNSNFHSKGGEIEITNALKLKSKPFGASL